MKHRAYNISASVVIFAMLALAFLIARAIDASNKAPVPTLTAEPAVEASASPVEPKAPVVAKAPAPAPHPNLRPAAKPTAKPAPHVAARPVRKPAPVKRPVSAPAVHSLLGVIRALDDALGLPHGK